MKVKEVFCISEIDWEMDVKDFVKQTYPHAGLLETHPSPKVQSVPAKGYGYMCYDTTSKDTQFFFVPLDQEEIGYARMVLKILRNGCGI